ncbi:sulfatase-like hydrolase/transferase [Pontiellaceae bacterium B1224]|nr:sulfatase-like hydrolase/transferase [Pontiellaceae bacterium B1224]
MKVWLYKIAAFALVFTGQIFAQSKPNIIFILADDLGYGDVGFTGQEKIRTPNLDEMAKEGMVFNQFYSGSTVCGPSRASLMFGQHTGHGKVRGNPGWVQSGALPAPDADDILLPKELKRAGYKTAHFGKWGLYESKTDDAAHPLKQGFDEYAGFNTHVEAHYHWPDYIWDGFEKVDWSGGEKKGNWKNKTQYAGDYFTERAVDYIGRQNSDEPFFMYLCYTAPHQGYTVPKESREKYAGLGWPEVPKKSGHYEMDPEMHTAYAGMIDRLDESVGKVRAKLAEKGLAENTLVFFTSDNGHEIGSKFFNSGGGFRGQKRDLTEGGIHMPTVAVWPEVTPAGTQSDTALAFWDVLPTFCALAGVETKADTDGISFVPTLEGDFNQQQKHEVLYWEANEKKGPAQAIRFGKWKALRFWDKEANQFGSVQLYNLMADQGEANDLAKQYPEVVAQSETYFKTERSESVAFPLVPHRRVYKAWNIDPVQHTPVSKDWKWISQDGSVTYSSLSKQYGVPHNQTLLTTMAGKQSFHSDAEKEPWVIIDLKKEQPVIGLEIFNRPDGNGNRTRNLHVWLSNDRKNWEPVFQTLESQKSWLIDLKEPKAARYIKIGLINEKPQYFHLKGVKVFALYR